MRKRKLLTVLGLTVIASQLLGCGGKVEIKPIEFEVPEQPVVSELIEAEDNKGYVILENTVTEEKSEDEILNELGCFTALTEEEAERERKAATSVASQYAGDGSASSPAIKTPPASAPTPLNPNDTFVKVSDGVYYFISSENGRQYSRGLQRNGTWDIGWARDESEPLKGW